MRRFRYETTRFERSQRRVHREGGLSYVTQRYLRKKIIKQLKWPANSLDINIIENIWSIVDNKLLQLNVQNSDDLKTVWIDISNDSIQKPFGSLLEICGTNFFYVPIPNVPSRKISELSRSRISHPEKFLIVPIPNIQSRTFSNCTV